MARRLGAQRSTAGWVGEQMGGLSYLQYIRQLVPRIESDWEGVKVLPHTGFPSLCCPEQYVVSWHGMPGTADSAVSRAQLLGIKVPLMALLPVAACFRSFIAALQLPGMAQYEVPACWHWHTCGGLASGHLPPLQRHPQAPHPQHAPADTLPAFSPTWRPSAQRCCSGEGRSST